MKKFERPSFEERLAGGLPWVVEIRREFMFHDVSPTIRRLVVTERLDGKFEFAAQGRTCRYATAQNL